MKMNRRPLGSTGLWLSILGLGTVKLGRAEQVKYPSPFAIPSDADAAALLQAAADRGINTVDTAPAYGNAEERLGGLLAGRRDLWNIVTKAGEEFDGGRSRFDFSPSAVRGSVERSLRRLRTDRVEVLLIHSDGAIEHAMTDELWAELGRLRAEGKARSVGVSTKSVAGALACLPRADVLMVSVDPLDEAQVGVVTSAQTAGVGILVKKALASGHAIDPAGALRSVLGVAGVTCAVVGTINPDHLRVNCSAVAGVR